MASTKDIYAKLEALKTDAPSKGGAGDPVENFIKAAQDQKKTIDAAIKALKDGKVPGEFNPRSDWFKKVRGGYRVHFGKFRVSTPNGTTHFLADSLEGVNEILDLGIELAESDKAFQGKITAASDDLKEKLAKGKAEAASGGRRK
ncbi:hypothetical protein QM996_02525 [Sinorhizobium chiapasense]